MEKQTIKFTNTGKKVAVLAEINSSQFLVQEIFVDPDTKEEAPEGERFVVGTLLDKPKKSWHQEQVERYEAQYEQTKERVQKELKAMEKTYRDAINLLKESANYARLVAKADAAPIISDIISFINGEFQFFVHRDYWRGPRILSREHLYSGERYCDGIRLVSLYGKDDGSFSFKYNEYRDGSGTWHEIVPCKTEEEALEKYLDALEERESYTLDTIKSAVQLGLADKLNPDKIADLYAGLEKEAAQKKESLTREMGMVNRSKDELDELLKGDEI